MPTKTTTERLSVIDEKLAQNTLDHQDIKITLGNINKKLDDAIVSKADKVDVAAMNNRMWGFVMVFVTAFIGMIVWLIEKN
jgi:hypothetical protein